MSPTLFDPPYSCTAAEYLAMTGARDAETAARKKAVDTDPRASDDARWTRIYDLCHLRGDSQGMAHALSQIQDRVWAAELTCRDIVETPPDLEAR
jgi:hypothetical protein